MEALTSSRTTASTVTLAATMWQGYGDGLGADPVGLVEYIVRGLADRGLLTFRESKGLRGEPGNAYNGLPHTIRLTREGWTLAGYPNLTVQVGTRMSSGQMLEQKGDRTNHRTHRSRAEGGDIETLTFPAHRAKYPDHIHPLMNGDTVSTTPNHVAPSPRLAPVDADEPSRGYIRVTPELEARVIAYRTRFPTIGYAELGEMLDLPHRTVAYVLTDLPRLRAVNGEGKEGSLKQRILWTLDALDMDNVRELRRVLGRADTDHDIVHVLHSLHKEGKVDFIEKGASKEPINIHLTKRGRGEGLPKSVKDEVVAATATAEEPVAEQAEAEAVAEPQPSDIEFPLLDALLDREKERLDADGKMFRYMEAADLIRANDPETAAILDTKAQQNDVPLPSPIEAEYLRYVARQAERGHD
jgi:hypothetical protein